MYLLVSLVVCCLMFSHVWLSIRWLLVILKDLLRFRSFSRTLTVGLDCWTWRMIHWGKSLMPWNMRWRRWKKLFMISASGAYTNRPTKIIYIYFFKLMKKYSNDFFFCQPIFFFIINTIINNSKGVAQVKVVVCFPSQF